MSGVNQFQTFAEGGSANTLTPAAYAALTTLLANGYQTGVASSQQINTTLRQSAFITAVIAGIVSDAGFDALDDGDLATFKTKLLASMSIPAGSMFDFAGAAAPSGFLLCTGAAISRTAYAKLFTAIGTSFGAGDGSTTFNIPDARNRTRVGSGSLYAVGGSGGNKDAIVVSHNHGVSDPGHNHPISGYVNQSTFQYSGGGGIPGIGVPLSATNSSVIQAATTGISVNTTGASGTDANMMPYFACPLIIKY